MKLVIPMAGRGTRLRPHTITTPKPLLPIAGKMLIERIVDTFSRTMDTKIDTVVFVLGDFGDAVEQQLKAMVEKTGAKCEIRYQGKPMGTAHAVHCAREFLDGEVIVAFADTLFDTGSKVQTGDADCIIWLKEVENPSSFGVAVMDGDVITEFVEKPTEQVSNKAIIGVYYFKKGEDLRRELDDIIDNDRKSSRGEYELTDAIDSLLNQGNVFKAANVKTWLDCGTLDSWLDTTYEILKTDTFNHKTFESVELIQPVFIAEGVEIENSTIGPFVSIEKNAQIKDAKLSNTIVNAGAEVTGSTLKNSTVGQNTVVKNFGGSLHIGDFSRVGNI